MYGAGLKFIIKKWKADRTLIIWWYVVFCSTDVRWANTQTKFSLKQIYNKTLQHHKLNLMLTIKSWLSSERILEFYNDYTGLLRNGQ